MKPLPFSLPALLCPQPSPEGESEDLSWPLHRPDRLLFPLPEQEGEGTQQWVEQFKAIIGDAQGFVMADCGMPVPQQRAALLACQERTKRATPPTAGMGMHPWFCCEAWAVQRCSLPPETKR